ncbi:MAG: NAD(P)/FAD-dependent oxidoreductase, partial [Gammaproteobacteria bacterium]|nr:NAD(P)/FAD-dependent oxidoreductase [Gammaproteobacteria bacterium]
MKQYDIIIIGAGAAGLMCAIEASKRGRKVL